jgi:uncharacterized protein (TIGR00255 family)
MPKSMTGYGRGEHTAHDRRFKVEMKSVNHRYSDVTIKLPRFLNAFEERVRKRLAKNIVRGKVEVWVNFESFTAKDVSVRINTPFADAYMEALTELAAKYELSHNKPSLQMLASHPEVLGIEKSDLNDENLQAELWETLSAALEQALANFEAMREAEGTALMYDIKEKKAHIQALLAQIMERAPAVAEDHAGRLRERIEETLAKVNLTMDEGRLLTEIAVFADRSCIDEEVTRLTSHLSQLDAMLSGTDATGRKMDFLVQEFNREANTIGSKSNDVILARLVVDLKSEIEKIREQVQNIE